MKKILSILFTFGFVLSYGQAYNPSLHVTVNDAIGFAQKTPADGRTMFWDASNFIWRDFQNASEVYSTLTSPTYRFGHSFISVHNGGTLNSNGTFTGGTSDLYWFRNGQNTSDLVKVYLDSVNVPKAVVYVRRLTDSTFFAARSDSTRDTVLIRGTAAGGINSLILNAPNTLFGTPVNFSSTGGAWAGSLVLSNQNPNYFFAGPSTGGTGLPLWRQIVLADLPSSIPNGNLQNSSIAFGTGTGGTDINWSATPISLGGTATLNIPNVGPSARGLLTSAFFNQFTNKVDSTSQSNDSVYDWHNGSKVFRYIVTGGGGSGITQLTGDGIAGPGTGSQAFTLTTVNSTVGTFGSASSVPVFTTNGKGLTTGVANTAIQITESQVTNLTTDLAGKQSALSGTGYLKFSGTTPSYLTPTQVTADLNLFTSSLQGLVPLSGGGTTNFLRADGTWAAPSGGGSQTLTYTQLSLNNTLSISGGNTQTFLVATHSLSGLMDSASKAVVDSLRLRTYTFPASGGGLTGGAGFSPLFTNGVSGSTLTFTASNAAANTAFGNFTGSSATAAFGKVPIAAFATGTANTLIGYDGSGNPSGISAGTNITISAGVISATGSGGSQTLDQTLALGNTTNKKILSTANIGGDSALYRNALFTGNVSIGDTNYVPPLFIYVIDNSIGVGAFASPLTLGYAYKLAYDYGWSSALNRSISGTTIRQVSAGDSSFENRIPTYINYNASTLSYFIVGSGINDLVTDTVNVKISLAKIIDSIVIERGWPTSRVINYSPPYSPARLTDSVFISAQRTICLAKGIIYVDVYHRMKALYLAGMQLVSSDSLHPSTLGHAYMEQWIAQAIDSTNPTIHMAGNLTVRGIADIKGNDTTRGNSYLGGLITAPTGIQVSTVVNTGFRFIMPFISTGGDRGLVKWVPNPSNTNFTDSFYWAYEGQGAQNAFVMGRAGTTNPGNKIYLSVDDDLIFHGNRSNAQTGFRYIFNGIGGIGGVYVNGPIKSVLGNSSLISLGVVGDAITGVTRQYNNYTNGLTHNGFQTNASGFLQFFSGANDIQFGSMSTVDGTTFTPIMQIFKQGGTGVGIGTTVVSTNYQLQVSPNMSIFGSRTMTNPLGAGGLQMSILPSKFTDNSSTTSQKNFLTTMIYFGADTIASTSAAVVDTNAVTLFIKGPPIASTNTTIINGWSLYDSSGKVYFGDSLVLNRVPTGLTSDSVLVIGANHTIHKVLQSSLGGALTIGAFSGSSQVNGANYTTGTLTFGPADATNPGMIKATGSQTLGATLTMPAPLFTGLTSSGANDSVLTVDPSTGQVHRRAGTTPFYFANGLTASTVIPDTAYWNGPLNQNTLIGTAGFTLSFTGLPNKATALSTDSVLIENAAGQLFKLPVPSGGGLTTVAFGATPNSNGGSISGATLTLQPADASNPGGVSIAAQTFAGSKTFSASVLMNSTSVTKLSLGTATVQYTLGSGGSNLFINDNILQDISSSGTVGATLSANRIGIPTFSASSSVNYNGTVANLYIAGGPVAGTNVTISGSKYAVYIAGGDTYSVGGSASFYHFITNGTTPSTAAGAGAGTSPTITLAGTDQEGVITVATGTTPGASGTIVTVTYSAAFPSNSFPTLTPANASTAALSGITMVYTTGSTTTFTITSGTAALTGATTYKWYYHVGAN